MRQTGPAIAHQPAGPADAMHAWAPRPPALCACACACERDGPTMVMAACQSLFQEEGISGSTYGVQPGRAPGIVAVMASAEAGEDTAMPAGGCRLPPARPVAVAIPATQLAAPALHDDATPLPACLPRSKACAWRACRPPARHQHPAGRPLRADLTSLHLSIIHRGLHACAVVREQGQTQITRHTEPPASGQVHSTTELNVFTTLLSLVAHEQVTSRVPPGC
jgi:hypothetical protein